MLNPILSVSATRRMRSFKTMAVLLAYSLVLLGLAAVLLGGLFTDRVNLRSMTDGVNCYVLMIGLQFGLLILIAPAMTSGAIAGERERQTLELLLVTETRSFRIVLGKMLECFALLALLIAAALPALCLTMVVGAVTLTQILEAVLFLLAVAFAASCVGVFASALSRSTVLSAVVSYLLIILIAVVTALPMLLGYPRSITDVVYDSRAYAEMAPGDALRMIHPLLYVNPGYGLLSLLAAQTGAGGVVMEYRDWGRILCTWKLMDKAGGETVGLISSGAVFLAGFLLLLAAAPLVRASGRKSGGRTAAK